MLPLHVEMLLGHDTGLSMSYYRPSEKILLEDYLKAVDLLTISDEKHLRKQVTELTKRAKDNDYVKLSLQEKDDQIQKLMKKQEQFEQLIQSLIDSGQLKPNIKAS